MDEKQLATTVRILGIDPGSRITGYGVIDLIGVKLAMWPVAAFVRLMVHWSSVWRKYMPVLAN